MRTNSVRHVLESLAMLAGAILFAGAVAVGCDPREPAGAHEARGMEASLDAP
jgi:hypothetical protein